MQILLIFLLPIYLCSLEPYWKPTKYVWSLGFALDADLPIRKIPPLTFDVSDYKNIQYGDVVWVKSQFLPHFATSVFPYLKVPIILVTTDGDESVPTFFTRSRKYPLILKMLDDDRLIHWYTQNYDYVGPSKKISPIPMGVNYQSIPYAKGELYWGEPFLTPEEQEWILDDILSTLKPTHERIPKAYADFHLHNSSREGYNAMFKRFKEDRKDIYKKLSSSPLIDFVSERVPRRNLWRKKGTYAFSISPIGNALDCHRTWEDLLLGCIVIVKTSPLDPLYKDLPVVIINNWNEITEANMQKWLSQYHDAFTNPTYREKLTHAYWMHKIKRLSEAEKNYQCS